MPITIGSNIASLMAQRQLGKATSTLESTYERLASGQRINRASDDAAGLAVATSLNVRTRVYTQAMRNVSDGVSYLSIADGGTKELKGILIRLKELAEQSANGTFSNVQRQTLERENVALQDEYNRIIDTTSFNGISVLKTASLTMQVGFEPLEVALGDRQTAAVGDGTFSARTVVNNSGYLSYTVTPADLNGDGILDLVADNSANNNLGVFIGNGDGTFRARQNWVAGSNPHNVVPVDINGDGNVDLLDPNLSGSISVILGNGDGTFPAPQSYSAPTPFWLSLADVNNDGKLDAITGANSTNTVGVLLGNGNGTFSAAQSFTSGTSHSYWVGSADLNGDSLVDIVNVDITSGTLSILLGNGDGTFQAQSTVNCGGGSSPREAAMADMNNDGKLDLLAVAYNTNVVEIFYGNGNGTFAAGRSYVTGNNTESIEASDINSDGKLDFVSIEYGPDTVSVTLGNGDGTFRAPLSYSVGLNPEYVSIADLNRDGVNDLMVSDFGAQTISILLGNGSSNTTAEGIQRISGISVATRTAALTALDQVNSYFSNVNIASGIIGASLSRLSIVAQTLSVTSQNTNAAESRIRDADIAYESSRLVTAQILQQAASAVLSQANQQPALALQLLR